MMGRGANILGGTALLLLAIDIASSFLELRYASGGEQSDRLPVHVLQIHAGEFRCAIAAQRYFARVGTSDDPRCRGWSIAANLLHRKLWSWQLFLEADAVLLRGTLWPIELMLFGLTLGARMRLRRRRTAESCDSCGYNLTGNVSGCCPECGAAVRNKLATPFTSQRR